MINEKVVQQVFKMVIAECARSITQQNLHTDPAKEEILAKKLDEAFSVYGIRIAGEFQSAHATRDPALSFLFAQVSNAVIEKTFHHGSCHAQAAYALVELAKHDVFNASLMWSDTGNPSTEHFYLLVLDQLTYDTIKQGSKPLDICILNSSARLPPDSLFFDSWSNLLCKCEHFAPENQYTRPIETTRQRVFKPFSCLFENSRTIFESIIFCLTEYKQRLIAAPNIEQVISSDVSSLFTEDDMAFQNEIRFLFDHGACVLKLLETIENYQTAFQEKLALLTQDEKLLHATSAFFKERQLTQWKVYPKDKLPPALLGHDLRFFTMRAEQSPGDQADLFIASLRAQGFSTEIKAAKSGSSIVVDLTKSITNLPDLG